MSSQGYEAPEETGESQCLRSHSPLVLKGPNRPTTTEKGRQLGLLHELEEPAEATSKRAADLTKDEERIAPLHELEEPTVATSKRVTGVATWKKKECELEVPSEQRCA